MKPIDDLMDAFEVYYSTAQTPVKYTTAQRVKIHNEFVWIKQRYAAELRDEVIRSHPSSLRSLPDVAVITDATRRLNPPESYEPPPKQIEDMTPVTMAEIERIREETGNGNPEERAQVRRKAARGEATLYELWWLECIDSGKGYKAMPESFRQQNAGVRQW